MEGSCKLNNLIEMERCIRSNSKKNIFIKKWSLAEYFDDSFENLKKKQPWSMLWTRLRRSRCFSPRVRKVEARGGIL